MPVSTACTYFGLAWKCRMTGVNRMKLYHSSLLKSCHLLQADTIVLKCVNMQMCGKCIWSFSKDKRKGECFNGSQMQIQSAVFGAGAFDRTC